MPKRARRLEDDLAKRDVCIKAQLNKRLSDTLSATARRVGDTTSPDARAGVVL
jgi:hypothetical protein